VAYWQLACATAAYRFCVEETDFLCSFPLPHAALQQTQLASLQAIVRAEEVNAKLTAVRAQYTLAESLPSFTRSKLPLAADSPFVGGYETHFEQIQGRGAVSERLSKIDKTLPVMRDLIERQANAVTATNDALLELRKGYEEGRCELATVVDSFEHLRQQRRGFLKSVQEYNTSIAEYAFAVASPNLPVNRVVGMLIETPEVERSVLASRRSGSDIRRVSNEAPVPSSSDGWSVR
jgi:hypothetical protein